MPEETLEWLWHELYVARTHQERIVITHRPLWAMDSGGKYGSPLHDILIAGGANWVLTGHWHHTMSDYRDGIHYQVIGPSGATPNKPGHPESGNFQQFGLLVIDDTGAELSIIKSGGILAWDTIPYGANQLEYQIENRAVQAVDFLLDALLPKNRGSLQLLLTNVTEEPLKTDIAFEFGGNWHMIPRSRPVELAPGGERSYRFLFERGREAPLFPGPRKKMSFPWLDDSEYRLEKSLPPTVFRRVVSSTTLPTFDGNLDEAAWRQAS